RYEQSAAATKDVDGRAILASAATAAVSHNAEVGQETCERPENAIGSMAVEAGDRAREWHNNSATLELWPCGFVGHQDLRVQGRRGTGWLQLVSRNRLFPSRRSRIWTLSRRPSEGAIMGKGRRYLVISP